MRNVKDIKCFLPLNETSPPDHTSADMAREAEQDTLLFQNHLNELQTDLPREENISFCLFGAL